MERLTKKRVFEILNSRFKEGFLKLSSLPQPNTIKDLQKGARRVAKAIRSKEKIVVVGDYDVDGIISSSIMKEFFLYINYPIEIIIPNRFKDGYGISKKLLSNIDTDVVITVDNG
ncbi:MAG TPA: single-stranded-DNA-specific exonuclease RecJ, partial [Campylobacterales bacterium]|nr:single-stranded-DNA-specific exonuclease RecJ [Campylobacterales bacterium]